MSDAICKQILVLLSVAVAYAAALNHVSAEEPGATTVSVQIDPAMPISEISPDFIGFGYETSAVAQSRFFSERNTKMIRLYRNLGSHGLIRIGGNVSDHTRYSAFGLSEAKTEQETTVISHASLVTLGEFARKTGWQVMWGLNLGTGSREEAVEEAIAVNETIGLKLHSFEIGNEVDLMRKYSKDYDAYHAAYLDYKTAIRAKLPNAQFCGPDSAANMNFVDQFVNAEAADMRLATYHYYRGGQADPKSTMEHLLTSDEGFDGRLDHLRKLCDGHHVAYRINEVNSFYGGGKQGVSDCFGSALWCLDYLCHLAEHGCAGVNMQTDINQHGFVSHYSPIAHDENGVCWARPEYYGMLAFAMAGKGHVIKTTCTKCDANFTAYATMREQNILFLALINKDLSKDVSVEFALPGEYTVARAYRLTAPGVDAKTGVSFGGAAVADDGSWKPAAPIETIPANAGALHITVPHASAAILKICN